MNLDLQILNYLQTKYMAFCVIILQQIDILLNLLFKFLYIINMIVIIIFMFMIIILKTLVTE